jgi:hypothetical protein
VAVEVKAGQGVRGGRYKILHGKKIFTLRQKNADFPLHPDSRWSKQAMVFG